MAALTRDRQESGGSDAVAEPSGSLRYQTNRDLTIQGIAYQRGDIVDVSSLSSFKVDQLLTQRILRPAD